MAVSMRCEQCFQVKRCKLYLDQDQATVYLCRPCARELGFLEGGEVRPSRRDSMSWGGRDAP